MRFLEGDTQGRELFLSSHVMDKSVVIGWLYVLG